MKPIDALADLRNRLAAARLNPSDLDPWEAWKVFKEHLRTEIEDVYDAAAFQSGLADGDDGQERFYAHFMRQFSMRDGDKDIPIRHIVIELQYEPNDVDATSAHEVWTLDFPTLAEFASVVEGLAEFQASMNAKPIASAVYTDEL